MCICILPGQSWSWRRRLEKRQRPTRLFSQSRGSLRARGSFTSFLTSPFLPILSYISFLNTVFLSRLKELELIKQELEQLLEEEKQAKRDEELVRTIQARMLTEEWER